MKIIFILLTLIGLPAQAVTETQEAMSPDSRYMTFFLDSYLPWHHKKFNSQFFKINIPDGENFLRKNLSQINHWKTPEFPVLDQILIGQSFKDNKASFVYQIYIHPEARGDKELKKHKFPGEVIFVQWDDHKNVCFLTSGEKEKIPFKINLPKDATGLFFHFCNNKNYKLSAISFMTQERSEWPTPFKSDGHEVRTYGPEGLVSVFYRNKFTHIGFIPSQFYHYINTHGQETHLPFDKYSTDKEGNLTVYYP